jgi:hypothetical protein
MFLLDFKIVPTFYFRNASCALSYTYLIFFLLVDCLEFCKKQSTFIVKTLYFEMLSLRGHDCMVF